LKGRKGGRQRISNPSPQKEAPSAPSEWVVLRKGVPQKFRFMNVATNREVNKRGGTRIFSLPNSSFRSRIKEGEFSRGGKELKERGIGKGSQLLERLEKKAKNKKKGFLILAQGKHLEKSHSPEGRMRGGKSNRAVGKGAALQKKHCCGKRATIREGLEALNFGKKTALPAPRKDLRKRKTPTLAERKNSVMRKTKGRDFVDQARKTAKKEEREQRAASKRMGKKYEQHQTEGENRKKSCLPKDGCSRSRKGGGEAERLASHKDGSGGAKSK